jgi:hypothetical protein
MQTQQVLAEYSGSYAPSLPDPVTSPSGKMFLVFSTNYSGTAPGWNAYYESNLVEVPEIRHDGNFLAYPNPTDGFLTVQTGKITADGIRISMKDPSGRTIFNEVIPEGKEKFSLDLRNLSPGIYILDTESGNNGVDYHKIIIK